MDNVPVVDLSGVDDKDHREALVATLDAALRQFGFFYVRNHGVEHELVQQQFRVAADMFALPEDAKKTLSFDSNLDIGYVASGGQFLDPDGTIQHSGDTKEQFMMTNNKLITDPASPSIDPEDVFEGSTNHAIPKVPDHAKITRAYMSAVYKLNQKLNSLLFDALSIVDESERLDYTSNPFCVLKQMRYEGELSDPARGKFGAGAHTDWGSFTILATDETPGLQIQMREKNWLPVPPKEGCLIINSGDQIAQLTNDAYRSAIHRVVTTSTTPRFSTAVFTYFTLTARVAPLPQFITDDDCRYPIDRTSLKYFHYKLKESFGKGGSIIVE